METHGKEASSGEPTSRDRGAEKGGRFCPNPKCGKLVEAKEDFLLNPSPTIGCTVTKRTVTFFCQRCGAKRGPLRLMECIVMCPVASFTAKREEGHSALGVSTIEVKRGKKKAGDVRCVECTKMSMETEPQGTNGFAKIME